MDGVNKMEDNFKEYNSAGVMKQIMRRFALGVREVLLLVAVVGVFLVCVVFAAMFAVSKTKEATAQAEAQKGRLYTQTCFTRSCLDITSHTLDFMNVSANPCVNFYQYACGNYRSVRPLDAQVRYHSPLRDLYLKNKNKLKTLIESPVKRNTEWASERKIKHLFQSCMDDYTHEKLKGRPFLKQVLEPLGGWYVLGTWREGNWDLNTALTMVQTDFWTDALWSPRVGVDWTDWKKRSIEIHPAGTGHLMRWLYYTDPASSKIRADYKKFMSRVAGLVVRDSNTTSNSLTKDRLQQFVTDAFSVETHIARIASSTEWRRNPYHDTNLVALDDLTHITGNVIDWTKQMKHLFNQAGITGRTKVAIYNYDYLRELTGVITNITGSQRARTLHNYLVWRVMESYVSDLSVEYNHANRELYEDLTGFTQFRGRWNYCFHYCNHVMRDAMGALFVSSHFGDRNREKVQEITTSTKESLQELLRSTPWLDEESRNYAEKKIKAITFKLGYPDYMMNQDKVDAMYDELKVNTSDWFGNILELNTFHQAEWNKELRDGEDRSKWYFRTFDTTLAVFWYWNQIVVPAGLLQFPVYNYATPHYFSFGSFGSLLGHFILHIVDEWGRGWDDDGERMQGEVWWSNATSTAYADVKQCVQEVYTNQTIGPITGPDAKTIYTNLNPARVATESIAVTSGVHLAWQSYKLWVSKHGPDKSAPTGLGITNEQMFFVAFGQIYCYNMDDVSLYRRTRYGNYVPGDLRVNLALGQLTEFTQTFDCSPTSTMNHANKCTLY